QEHHAEVRLRPLLPLRITEGREVEQGLAEGEEVLGQVVDRRRVRRHGRAGGGGRAAVQVGGAAGLERERGAGEVGVEGGAADRQRVRREVAGGVHGQVERQV